MYLLDHLSKTNLEKEKKKILRKKTQIIPNNFHGDSHRIKPSIPLLSSSVRFTQNLPVSLRLKFILAFCPPRFPRIEVLPAEVQLPTSHLYFTIVPSRSKESEPSRVSTS